MRQIKPSLTAQDWQSPQCYGCGPDNPHSLRADFRFDEEVGEVRFLHRMRGFEVGAPGYVHGGAMATLLDEAQGALCHHIGHIIMTDKLTMKYHKAVPMDMEMHIRCIVTAVRKRRMYTRATISSATGEVHVSSTASWYLLPERIAFKLFKDTITEEGWNFMKGQIELNRKRAKEIRKKLRRNKPA